MGVILIKLRTIRTQKVWENLDVLKLFFYKSSSHISVLSVLTWAMFRNDVKEESLLDLSLTTPMLFPKF